MQRNDKLRSQLTVLATELAGLHELIGRNYRNSSRPPFSVGLRLKPLERRNGSGRRLCGQPGHPGSGPELLPIERVDEVVEHPPDTCRRCCSLLKGEDPGITCRADSKCVTSCPARAASMRLGRQNCAFPLFEAALPETDLEQISFLKAIPDSRMRRRIRNSA